MNTHNELDLNLLLHQWGFVEQGQLHSTSSVSNFPQEGQAGGEEAVAVQMEEEEEEEEDGDEEEEEEEARDAADQGE